MDWDWLRSSSGVGPFSLTGTSRPPDFELLHASQIRAPPAFRMRAAFHFSYMKNWEAVTLFAEGRGYCGAKMPLREYPAGRACCFQDAL